LQRSHNLPDATVLVFEGLVFLVVLYSDSLYGKLPFFKEKPVDASPPAVTPKSPSPV
jgi:simple sugar transport system permease protein